VKKIYAQNALNGIYGVRNIEFLKDHGSNNQLFLTLRKQITIIQKTENKIHDKGYRCEDQALEINRKVCVGGSFGVDMRGESLQK
jgi:hypothetical protein